MVRIHVGQPAFPVPPTADQSTAAPLPATGFKRGQFLLRHRPVVISLDKRPASRCLFPGRFRMRQPVQDALRGRWRVALVY